MGKSTFAPPLATVHHEMVSNKGVQMVMHFASEERGEPKLHSLSPPIHLLAALGPTLQQRREGAATPAQSAPPPVATQGAAVAVTTRRRGARGQSREAAEIQLRPSAAAGSFIHGAAPATHGRRRRRHRRGGRAHGQRAWTRSSGPTRPRPSCSASLLPLPCALRRLLALLCSAQLHRCCANLRALSHHQLRSYHSRPPLSLSSES
jgi:hypothetical protein